jgi:hypothetical protein
VYLSSEYQLIPIAYTLTYYVKEQYMYTVSEVNTNLKNMLKELGVVKSSAVYLLNKISHGDPSSFMGAGQGEMSPEDSQGVAPGLEGSEPDGTPSEGAPGEGAPGEEGKPGEKKAPEIKTPDEAKKTVNEAITDLKAVVDGIDNITDQGQDMEEKTSSQTFRLSAKATSEIGILTNQAVSAMDDAQGAIKHWSFMLRKNSNPKTASGNQFVNAVKEGVQVFHELREVLGTAVAPTGAEFSGDKTLSKNPAAVEMRQFEAGNEQFRSDKKKYDAMPNPASSPRLTDEGNPHELGAYVEAKAVERNDKFSSAIVVRSLNKDKKGKYAVLTFENLPEEVGKKTTANYAKFLLPGFAKNIEAHVRKSGIDAVAAYLNGRVDTIGLATTAREPKIKDKAELRAYYKDAYGDDEFARELTSGQKTSVDLAMGINQDKTKGVTRDTMDIAYKPEFESANAEKGGLEGGNKTDSLGDGKAPTKDASLTLEARQGKARAAVDLARLASSRGLVPFTKTGIKDKALEIIAFSDEKFNAYKEVLEGMPEVNAILLEAHIPDADTGIVGNKREGVRNPKEQAKTDGLDSQVKSDAKISESSKQAQLTRTANMVPQMQVTSALTKESFAANMDTLQNRLAKRGLTLEGSVRRVGPVYRKK